VKSTSILTCAAVAGALLCYLKCIDIYVLSASVKQFIVNKPDKFFMGKPSQNRGGATNSIMGVQISELVSEKNFVPQFVQVAVGGTRCL